MSSTAFWTLPFGILGAVSGSFLNVVIYRLPRGLSVSHPRWSFCPSCHKRISARDNVPVFGWLLLGGKCRNCKSAISNIYPIVECITYLVFVALWDVLLVSAMTPYMGGITSETPVVLAMATLFSGMIASAGMDIDSYTIDIRVPLLTSGMAVVFHVFRGMPDLVPGTPHALPPSIVALAFCAGAAWFAVFVLYQRKKMAAHAPPQVATEFSSASGEQAIQSAIAAPAKVETPAQPDPAWPVVLLALIAAGLTAWIMQWPDIPQGWMLQAGALRGVAVTSLLLLVLILASMVHRPGDVQIVTDIETERVRARPMALMELATFVPSILACVAVFIYLRANDRMGITWQALVDSGGGQPWLVHLYAGLAAVAAGIAAAAIGWAVRISGTLAFGKEAFGTGDIYLLGAIGAAGGLWFTVISFFMAALLALIGVVATSFRKSSRAIPFGPWLGLGAFSALWLEKPLSGYFGLALNMFWEWLCGHPWALHHG